MPDAPPTQLAPSAAGGLFPLTRWTCVSALRRDPDSHEAQRALADLCQAYWYPVYAFARRKGQSVADAQDLTQGFFAKVLHGNFFANAQSEHGKMRSYLLTAFTRHMADEWDHSQAKKRGGGTEVLSLDFDDGEQRYLLEPASNEDLERSFDRSWAVSVLECAGQLLEAECVAEGKAGLFAHLSPLITGADADAPSYDELAHVTGMTAEALRQSVRRLRLRFRLLLRRTIADTLNSPDDAAIDSELTALKSALGG
jgi:DNA-directed RNA polymerase specialized sigma24 family protein